MHATVIVSTLALIGLVACGADPSTTPEPDAAGGAGSGGDSGGDGGGAEGPSCPAPEPAHLGEVAEMATVSASLVDQYDEPAGEVRCTICGVNICSGFKDSEAGGAVTIDGEGYEFQDPRFNTGFNGKGFSKMSALIPTKPSHDFGTVRVLRLPGFDQGVAFEPGQEITQSGVTLGLPADAVVDFDLLFGDAAEQKFVATVVDIRTIAPAELPAVDPALGLEVLIGLGALHTHICPAASLRFPNVAEWPAGSAVELFINGTETFDHYAPYGQWAKIADAVVSEDGATVSSDAGVELLTTLGARPEE